MLRTILCNVNTVKKFIGFFHNGQIGRHVGIKDKVKPARLGGSHEFLFAPSPGIFSKHFGNCDPDRRCGLQHHHPVRIGEGPHDLGRVVHLFNGSGGTEHRTLSARDTIRFFQHPTGAGGHAGGRGGNAHRSSAAGRQWQWCFQNLHSLQLIARSDAPRTTNAQTGIVRNGIGTHVDHFVTDPGGQIFQFQRPARRQIVVVRGKPLRRWIRPRRPVQVASECGIGQTVQDGTVYVHAHGVVVIIVLIIIVVGC
mmetsp:Transcript_28384/g.77909  ORF Transcript_28384/g.77909 Transcript_28384/m.77909 type:complete len:253 (-) Transcript_28384:1083-1841(-)